MLLPLQCAHTPLLPLLPLPPPPPPPLLLLLLLLLLPLQLSPLVQVPGQKQ